MPFHPDEGQYGNQLLVLCTKWAGLFRQRRKQSALQHLAELR
jgi:hypothetical protein